MIPDWKMINVRAPVQYSPDPFFTSRDGLVLPRETFAQESVTENGESQSFCGGACSMKAPKPATVEEPSIVQTTRPAITRAIQALGRVLANI